MKNFRVIYYVGFSFIIILSQLFGHGTTVFASIDIDNEMIEIARFNDPGWISVEGSWKYEDRNANFIYADRFLVQLLSYLNPDPTDPLDEDLTDSNGYYQLSTYGDSGDYYIAIYPYANIGNNEIMVTPEAGGSFSTTFNYLITEMLYVGSNPLGDRDFSCRAGEAAYTSLSPVPCPSWKPVKRGDGTAPRR